MVESQIGIRVFSRLARNNLSLCRQRLTSFTSSITKANHNLKSHPDGLVCLSILASQRHASIDLNPLR
jgi:hypothetical protein